MTNDAVQYRLQDRLAEILVWADRVGRVGQGVSRLSIYAKRLSLGLYSTPLSTSFRQLKLHRDPQCRLCGPTAEIKSVQT